MKSLRFLALAFAATLSWFGGAQAESWTTRPTEDVQAELATLLGCEWEIFGGLPRCYRSSPEMILDVTRNDIDGTIAQMWTDTLIEHYPRDRARETRSRETTAKLLNYLFPEWKGSSAWLTKALRRVRANDWPTSIAVDGATIEVRSLETAGMKEYAELTISKKRPPDVKHAGSWKTSPMKEIEGELSQLFNCEWEGADGSRRCYGDRPLWDLGLSPDPADGLIATVDISVPIDDRRNELNGRETIARLLAYFFPNWKGRDAWSVNALRRARASKPTSTQIDDTTIYVQWFELQDYRYAHIHIAKPERRDTRP